MLESKIEQAAVKFAHGLGIQSHKLILASKAGWPDRTFMYKGQTLFIEFKQPGKRPTPLQEFTLQGLRANGFPADWCDDADEAKIILTEWKKDVDTNR